MARVDTGTQTEMHKISSLPNDEFADAGTLNSGSFQAPVIDEEEVRVTAYFLWEQDGRPLGRDEHYWWLALERLARQKANDALLSTPPPTQSDA